MARVYQLRALWSLLVLAAVGFASAASAQSPELAMRELASGQIKKGVRSIGFGGDGATWGNYALVWRDAGSALIDDGETAYTNGNTFTFTAAGYTSPDLWQGLDIYAIALSQSGRGIHLRLDSPGLGPGATAVHGDGSDQALFVKIATPLSDGFSIGALLSYETSQFDLASDNSPATAVNFKTDWRPSGGFGVTWQPDPRILAGVRALFNNDWERRTDASGTTQANSRNYEYRAGVSVSPWKGALIDVGGTLLDRSNGLAGTRKISPEPNLGIEQAFRERAFVIRAGLDETTAGAGFSIKIPPFNLDVAYLRNAGQARIGTIFGEESNSLLATLTLDYERLLHRPPQASGAARE